MSGFQTSNFGGYGRDVQKSTKLCLLSIGSLMSARLCEHSQRHNPRTFVRYIKGSCELRFGWIILEGQVHTRSPLSHGKEPCEQAMNARWKLYQVPP